MSVPSPVPVHAAVLVLALPCIGWLAWRLARAVAPARDALILTAPIALACWLLPLHVAGYVTRSADLGLWIGSLFPAALGLIAFVLRRKLPQHDAPAAELPPPWYVWGGAAAVMIAVAPIAFGWTFHDEINLTGHMSIASQIQNGIYPPRHLTLASFELRYHYGFDTLVASIGSVFRLPIDKAIDALTIFAWGSCWPLASHIGSRIGGLRSAWFLPPLLAFGGGIPVMCEAAYDAPLAEWVAGCVVDHAYVAPPTVSFLFQHPYTLGLPLGLALIALYLNRTAPSRYVAMVACLLFLALAQSQVVMLAAIGAALPAVRLVEELITAHIERKPVEWSAVWPWLAASPVAVAAASQLGGMFASAPSDATMLRLRLGPASSLLGSIEWDFASFGLFLPFGLIGTIILARRRIILPLSLLAGSLAIIHSVAHAVTWDIAKFAVVTQLALVFGTAEVIGKLADLRSIAVRRIAVVLSFAILLHAGFGFHLALTFAPQACPTEVLPKEPARLEPDDARVVEYLRARALPGDVVYRRRKRVAYGYAEWGGLPQIWSDRQMEAFGFPEPDVRRRAQLLSTWPASIEPYRTEGIRWLILDQEDIVLAIHAERWVARGEASIVMRQGALTVIEVTR